MMRVRELRASYHAVPGTEQLHRAKINHSGVAAGLFRRLLQAEASEVFAIALVDTKQQLIAVSNVARGSLDSCLVHPREVFKLALLGNAASIITAHNHPSGDPTPSPDDFVLFQRLTHAGEIVGVEILDHIIIGDGDRFWSQQRGQQS